MRAFEPLSAVAAPIEGRNVNTDTIFPARFLRKPWGPEFVDYLFHDRRFDPRGAKRPEFILNQAPYQDARILVCDANFGCGSSREHAPWALLAYGIKAVISTEIADIFRNNALKNGLLPIVVDDATHQWLLQNPGTLVDIDVAALTLTLADGNSVNFPIDEFARYCLIQGIDQLGFLRQQLANIDYFEETRSWTP